MAAPTCTVCAKSVQQPALVCLACSEGVSIDGELDPTYYCDSKCQAADKIRHAKHCADSNTRKGIYRAGEILQTILIQWRRAAFDLKITAARKEGTVLHVVDGPYGETPEPIFDFPDHLVPDPADQAALLSFLAAGDAVGLLHPLAAKLLKGLCTSVEEPQLSPKQENAAVQRFLADEGKVDKWRYSHVVLSVEANDGNTYIIDLAGAQWHQYKAVLPFDKYYDSQVRSIDQVQQFGNHWSRIVARPGSATAITYNASYDHNVRHLQLMVHAQVMKFVGEWEVDNQQDIRAILDFSKPNYAKSKESLKKKITKDLTLFLQGWKAMSYSFQPFLKGSHGIKAEKQRPEDDAELVDDDPDTHSVNTNSRAYHKMMEDMQEQMRRMMNEGPRLTVMTGAEWNELYGN